MDTKQIVYEGKKFTKELIQSNNKKRLREHYNYHFLVVYIFFLTEN